MSLSGRSRRVLIIVENLPVPFDRRVWQEAQALHRAGYQVSVICPVGQGYDSRREDIDGIGVYRHPLPVEGKGVMGYLVEYPMALFWQFLLAWRVFLGRGFDVIHACNPPDDIFLIGLFFKLFGKKFLFDHHDINPELYEVKFGRKDILHKVLLFLERMTFRTANVVISTNDSYRKIALVRGEMEPERVFVVRSSPDLRRLKPSLPIDSLRRGRRYLVGYVGVMGAQDGIDILLRIIRNIVHEQGRKDIQFLLIGGGTELDGMIKYAAELNLSEFVTFTGFLRGQELIDTLGTIDIGVCPDPVDDYNDKCTMNKVMEYMALGKALVQFDLTEGRFSAQQAALYAVDNDEQDFANKVIQLLDDSKLRKEMGQFGKRRMESELDWQYEVPKLLSAYEKVFE